MNILIKATSNWSPSRAPDFFKNPERQCSDPLFMLLLCLVAGFDTALYSLQRGWVLSVAQFIVLASSRKKRKFWAIRLPFEPLLFRTAIYSERDTRMSTRSGHCEESEKKRVAYEVHNGNRDDTSPLHSSWWSRTPNMTFELFDPIIVTIPIYTPRSSYTSTSRPSPPHKSCPQGMIANKRGGRLCKRSCWIAERDAAQWDYRLE
jgi:hypothetical protein